MHWNELISFILTGTVFAYGQTNSGKTFTMRGSANEPGIIPLAVHDLFQRIQEVNYTNLNVQYHSLLCLLWHTLWESSKRYVNFCMLIQCSFSSFLICLLYDLLWKTF